MADDIEEFLKRVAEKRRNQQSGRAPANQPKPQAPAQRPPQQRQAPPPQQRPVAPPPVVQRQSLSDYPEAEAAGTVIRDISTTEVQKHAQEYMSRAEFETRSKQVGLHSKPLAHLESNVAKAHPMTRRSDLNTEETPIVAVTESPIAALLKSPDAFRSAFILSLVLDRPAWKDD